MKRKKTRYVGVFERASSINKFQGRPDIAYDYCYKLEGKLIWKCAGYKSGGMTPAEASRTRNEEMKRAKGKSILVQTFEDAWNLYKKDWLEANGKRTRTDQYLFNYYLKDQIGTKELDKITPMDINNVIFDIKNLSLQTKNHVYSLVRRVYKRLIAWQLYSGNIPTEGIHLKHPDNKRLRFLTREEAKLLLEELDKASPKTADIARVSLYAGLRMGEIFHLKVQHIHFDTGLMDIMDAKAGTRQAYMNDTLRKVLQSYCEGKTADSYVFTKEDGKSSLERVSFTFFRAIDRLGLNQGIEDARNKVVFHTLRHTFASWLVQEGVPLYTVSELLGHKSIAMTQRYAKLAKDNKQEAVKLLEK